MQCTAVCNCCRLLGTCTHVLIECAALGGRTGVSIKLERGTVVSLCAVVMEDVLSMAASGASGKVITSLSPIFIQISQIGGVVKL